jgi:HlyD family secretion protein
VNAIAGADADVQRAEAELANAVAGVPQKKAQQLAAEIDLERTVIRSPIDGVVVGRSFSEGQTVASSLEAPTLFMIAGDLERMDIHTRVDESDIGRIKVGQQATFTVDAHPGRQFNADVVAVRQAPQQPGSSLLRRAQPASSNVVTYTVILRTDNPSMLLLPGMTADVRVIVDEAKDALTVPVAAFRFNPQPQDQGEKAPPREPNVETVWVWDGRAPRSVAVEVGAMDGVRAAARSAPRLNEGDQVIVAQAFEAAPKPSVLGIKFGL